MLLVIGIDGASSEAIERLTSTGLMPNLRTLMRHGVYGRLQTDFCLSPVASWSSILTGVNPGKHGVWATENFVADSYERMPVTARALRAPTIAQLLTEHGLEVGTLFVPMTFPAREADWTTVSGWLAPSTDTPGFAHPRRIASMAARALQDVPLVPRLGHYAATQRFVAGLEECLEAIRAKARLASEVLAEKRWDMLAVNFTELDWIQRWYWHLIDARHPDHREELLAIHGDLISEAYAEVDEAIGRLIRLLKPRDHVIVVSPYGVGLNSRAHLCVSELMAHLDFLAMRSSAGGLVHAVASSLGHVIDSVYAALRGILPGGVADMINDTLEEGGANHGEADPWVDYERSWVLPTTGGHLFLNTQDEFPAGVVTAGSLDWLTMRVTSALQTAIDPATGSRPLQSVHQRERLFSGPFLSRIPHIVTRWESRRVVSGLTATGRDGRVKVARPRLDHVPSGRPGLPGMMIAAGSGLRGGTRVEGVRLEDVTATIMHLCGQRVPTYLDGRVLSEGFTPAYLDDNPVRKLERDQPRVIEDPGRIDEAARLVREHLRELGDE